VKAGDSEGPVAGDHALREALEAADALVTKLHAVHADGRYSWVWQCAQIHGGPYKGPTYEAELARLSHAMSALASARPEPAQGRAAGVDPREARIRELEAALREMYFKHRCAEEVACETCDKADWVLSADGPRGGPGAPETEGSR
jgi:hypothetical protein